jgi:hypothetical protein
VLAAGDQFFVPEPGKAGPAQISQIRLPTVTSSPDQIVLRVKVNLRQHIPLHIFIHGKVDKPLHRTHKTENVKGALCRIISIPKGHNVSPGYRHHVPLIIFQCLCSDLLKWLFVEFVNVILFSFIGALVQFHILDISVFDATVDLERAKVIRSGQLVPNEINFDKGNPIVSFEQMNLAHLQADLDSVFVVKHVQNLRSERMGPGPRQMEAEKIRFVLECRLANVQQELYDLDAAGHALFLLLFVDADFPRWLDVRTFIMQHQLMRFRDFSPHLDRRIQRKTKRFYGVLRPVDQRQTLLVKITNDDVQSTDVGLGSAVFVGIPIHVRLRL